jgi:hypothetical protein
MPADTSPRAPHAAPAPAPGGAGAAAARPSPRLLAGIAAFVAVFGIACTWWLGSAEGWATAPGARPPAPPIAQSAAPGDGADDEEAHAPNAAEIEAMVERLAERLQQQPDNVQGWLMLGRSRAVLGQLDQAAAAFQHVLSLQPAQDQAQEAQEGLAQVQAMAAQQTAAMAPGATAAPTDTAATATAAPAASGAGVSGRVELAPALATRVAPGDTVFVFARAAQGSRMPLAIVKRQARDLPFDFTLDDSSAMTPQSRLSQADRVVIRARISKTGQATPQPGVFEVLSGPMAPGASGLKLVLAEPVR